MVKVKEVNAVVIFVRDLARSLEWYKKRFGFEKMYDVSEGVAIAANSDAELVLSEVGDGRGIAPISFSFEVTEEDLLRVQANFPEDDKAMWVYNPDYRSCLVDDPDGHRIELFVDKSV